MATRRAWIALAAVVASCIATTAGAFAATEEDHRMLALTLYHEARSEGREAMVAVGWVVLNRIASEDFPDNAAAVITEGGEESPCQWGWYCDGRSDTPHEDDAWEEANELAAELLGGDPPADPTDGALFMHRSSVDQPEYTAKLTRTATIGGHYFYR